MKTLTTILTIGLLIALTTASAFSGGHERRVGDTENRKGIFESRIYGVVEQLPEKGLSGAWVVNGKEITVTRDTFLEEEYGKVEIGAYVKVEGTQNEKTFTAYKIEVKRAKEAGAPGRFENKYYGTVEKLPAGLLGTWVVSGKEIFVSKDTVLKEKHGKAGPGAAVEVEGMMSGETFTAYKIEVKQPGK